MTANGASCVLKRAVQPCKGKGGKLVPLRRVQTPARLARYISALSWQQRPGRLAFLALLSLSLAWSSSVVMASSSIAALSPSEAVLPSLAEIPNVTIEYYSVRGRTAEEVRAAINAKGLLSETDGRRVDALSRTALAWQWKEGRGAPCRPVDPVVTFKATIVLPRLADDAALPARLRVRWRLYARALETHEAGHVRAAYLLVGAITQAIASSNCTGADGAAEALIAQLQERDVEYDRATEHGRNQGAVFP